MSSCSFSSKRRVFLWYQSRSSSNSGMRKQVMRKLSVVLSCTYNSLTEIRSILDRPFIWGSWIAVDVFNWEVTSPLNLYCHSIYVGVISLPMVFSAMLRMLLDQANHALFPRKVQDQNPKLSVQAPVASLRFRVCKYSYPRGPSNVKFWTYLLPIQLRLPYEKGWNTSLSSPANLGSPSHLSGMYALGSLKFLFEPYAAYMLIDRPVCVTSSSQHLKVKTNTVHWEAWRMYDIRGTGKTYASW